MASLSSFIVLQQASEHFLGFMSNFVQQQRMLRVVSVTWFLSGCSNISAKYAAYSILITYHVTSRRVINLAIY